MTNLYVSIYLTLSLAACAARPQYDQSEHLQGLARHPLQAESYQYQVDVVVDGPALILRVHQEGLCRFVEQRVYERADVRARRMRQRYQTRVLPQTGPCERKPAQDQEVLLVVADQRHLLGYTDSQGTLRLQLDDTRVDLWRRGRAEGVSLMIGGTQAVRNNEAR